jgi:hypothetical protein
MPLPPISSPSSESSHQVASPGVNLTSAQANRVQKYLRPEDGRKGDSDTGKNSLSA